MQISLAPSKETKHCHELIDVLACAQGSSAAKLITGATGSDLEGMHHHNAAAARPAVKPGLIALLIAVSAVSPLGINMYLPSMPGMARALGVDFTTIQLTLSLYLGAMAVGQLIIGPLSDRFGRRPVLLIGLLTFVAGSVLCLLAQSIDVLIFGRIVQALGGCAGITSAVPSCVISMIAIKWPA